ncbi:MAG: EamA family transporter [Candidatus Parcubacteria bacterium]|nr:EamA family transporter [Candidatus Parcubacteria bacterium]
MWLYLAIFAYFLFAIANIGDKLMVSKYKTEPLVYAFYVGILGVLSVILIPLGVYFPVPILLIFSLLAGLAFVLALFFMYKALCLGETSKAITIMGGSSPIFTFLLANLFLHENLQLQEIGAFLILVLAIILISWEKERPVRKKYHESMIFWSVMAGLFFAVNYTLTKHLFNQDTFINVFFWTRMGGVITAIIILLIPKARKLIKTDWKRPKKQKGALVFGIQATGGLGVVLQSYALTLASPTLVNALQAIQYALVFVFAHLLGRKIHHLQEKISTRELVRKILAFALIFLGLYLLAKIQ